MASIGRRDPQPELRSAQDVMSALADIASSEEPAVVLSSLARCCTPSFSDACAIELSEGTGTPFRVCFPVPDVTELPADAGTSLTTGGAPPVEMSSVISTFEAESSHGYPAFAGMAVHFWAGRDPTDDDATIARLLVDRALAIVQHERLAQAAARADSRAATLAIDLITSRIEGEATGILMAQHHVTRAQAASLLRQASQRRRRTLPEVAAGVVRGGDLDSLAHRPAGSPEQPVDFHSASAPDQLSGPIRLRGARSRDAAHLR